MNKKLLFLLLVICLSFVPKANDRTLIERQGKVTFFSYTPVENIQATNNKALSFFDPDSKQIAVRILMRAFIFKKSLMYEHFNESYIESDLYPEAVLDAIVIDFDKTLDTQTRIIKGDFTLRGITKPLEIKTTINKEKKRISF